MATSAARWASAPVNTLFNTAHQLLLNTVLFIMGITVLSGALSQLLSEFGVIRLLEVLLAPLMKPVFRLPGRTALAALMTFFSDNPAVISLAGDSRFRKGFTPGSWSRSPTLAPPSAWG